MVFNQYLTMTLPYNNEKIPEIDQSPSIVAFNARLWNDQWLLCDVTSFTRCHGYHRHGVYIIILEIY